MTLERIGPYRVVRKIGEGGMGAVLEAVQEPIGRRVAVKVLHRKYALEPQITARFFNEARAVNLIDHPGIVQVSDYGRLPDGTAYLVMEYLKGETLNQRAKRGSISLPEIVRMARQIAAALAAAHEKNVFHRDLKPDNVMIVPDPDSEMPGRERVKLLDFGIAKVVEAEEGDKSSAPKTATDVVMGTPRYMAPEQCRGGAPVDGKADVYSLGVLLYELLAGKPPFSGASGEVLAMHIYEQPKSLRELAPHVPEELTNLIHRLLAKKKEDRPTMLEVQAGLEQVSVRHPTAVLQAIKWMPPPPMPPTPPSSPMLSAQSGSGVPMQPSTLGMSTGQAEAVTPRRRARLWIPVATFALALTFTFGLFRILRPSPTVTPKPEEPGKTSGAPHDPGKVVVEVTPLHVHFSLASTPPGAQIIRISDNKVLGTTPWTTTEEAGTGQLDLRLRLSGYTDKIVHFDRGIDGDRSETLDPIKKPTRPGPTGRSQSATGKPNLNGSKPSNNANSHEEQPRIVD